MPRLRAKTAANLVLDGTQGDDALSGGAGHDILRGLGGADVLAGGDGNDAINGGAGDDVLNGGSGDDTIDGGRGNDIINGGDGNDHIIDHYGTNVIAGGDGNDVIKHDMIAPAKGGETSGGNGDDWISLSRISRHMATGGAGNDTFVMATNTSSVSGGPGSDIYRFRYDGIFGRDNVIQDFLPGNGGDVIDVAYIMANSPLAGYRGGNPFGQGRYLRLTASHGDTLLQLDPDGTGRAGTVTLAVLSHVSPDQITPFNLGGYDPSGTTVAGRVLTGSNGADHLTGTAHADVLQGYAGNDWLAGGGGWDTLAGGAGRDTFVFDFTPGQQTGIAILTDFSHWKGDTIALDLSTFPDLGHTGTLADGAFYAARGATDAHDAGDRIIYDMATGTLYHDPDGIGGHAAIAFAQLGTGDHPALTFADIQIIA